MAGLAACNLVRLECLNYNNYLHQCLVKTFDESI